MWWKILCMEEIDMIDNKLKVGDIIVITYGETANYLQIGKVIDIRPYRNPDNISEQDIADYLKRWKNETRRAAIRDLRKHYKYNNEYPYVVEFNLSKVDGTGSYCDLRISTRDYDESLPRKSIILYREEEENV